MECNKDEAIRAKAIAEEKMERKDYIGAKKFALKAQHLYPGLVGTAQMLTTIDVYISADSKISGGVDWYRVLGVEASADDETLKKQYRKLALVLHPDKNNLVGADGAFKIVLEAWSLLSDKSKRLAYDQRMGFNGFQQKVKTHESGPSAPSGANGSQWSSRGSAATPKAQNTTAQAPPKTQNSTAQAPPKAQNSTAKAPPKAQNTTSKAPPKSQNTTAKSPLEAINTAAKASPAQKQASDSFDDRFATQMAKLAEQLAKQGNRVGGPSTSKAQNSTAKAPLKAQNSTAKARPKSQNTTSKALPKSQNTIGKAPLQAKNTAAKTSPAQKHSSNSFDDRFATQMAQFAEQLAKHDKSIRNPSTSKVQDSTAQAPLEAKNTAAKASPAKKHSSNSFDDGFATQLAKLAEQLARQGKSLRNPSTSKAQNTTAQARPKAQNTTTKASLKVQNSTATAPPKSQNTTAKAPREAKNTAVKASPAQKQASNSFHERFATQLAKLAEQLAKHDMPVGNPSTSQPKASSSRKRHHPYDKQEAVGMTKKPTRS